jgi:arylsulfatase A-like enzyme
LTTPSSCSRATTLSIDLAPTLLELAGVQPGADLQGRSVIPVLEHDSCDWRSSFLVEYYTDTVFPRINQMGSGRRTSSGVPMPPGRWSG